MVSDSSSLPLIGQYIDTYLPVIDGVVVTVQNYARWLTQEHFPCYVASARAPKGYQDTEPYQVIRFGSVPIAGHPPYRFGIPLLDMRFLASQHHVTPSLVHAHSPFSAGAEARRIARKLQIPLVASFHSKYYDDILQATGSKFIAERGVSLIVDFYNKADFVWTVNQGTAQTLRDYGYNKAIEIMPNGTEFIFPADVAAARAAVENRYGLQPDDKLLLFVGQHVLQKNLLLLLDSVSQYGRQGGSFKLLMIGNGYARQDLEARAAELGLADRVIFGGVERDRERLSEIYLRADLFTFPSIYDNAPLVIREAAMAGCPSVLVAGSNAAENARDEVDAFLCENSPESLCQAISRALASDEKRRAVGEAARRAIAKPWRVIVEGVAARYLDILQDFQVQPSRHSRLAGRRPGRRPGRTGSGL